MQKILITLAIVSLLGGCQWFSFPGVYKINIPQGNVVTQDMVDQLKPGMTKKQVQFIMGTPLIKHTFNQDRWDYLYSYQPGGEERTQERMSLFFKDDKLVRFAGDFIPGAARTTEEDTADALDPKADSATPAQ